MGEPAEEWLAVTPEGGLRDEAQVHLWALVLAAREIPCRIVPHDGGWQLVVPTASLATAHRELTLFAEENRHWPPPEPPARPLVENILATLSVLVLLATFHNITRLDVSFFGHPAPDWVYLGSAKAHLIKYGEWWRLVTSLTLHADVVHLISNLAIGGLFVIALCRELGSGLAWSLLLLAGSLGNLANAYTQLPTHSSVGASTTVFGAVGILAALNMIRRRFHRQRRWALPVAAALALLALLGTEGKNTDLGAHLYGFLFGAGLGLTTEWLVGRYGLPGRKLNALLAIGSAVLVVAAWWAALVVGA